MVMRDNIEINKLFAAMQYADQEATGDRSMYMSQSQ
jgi:hypothetical protein